MKDHVKEFETKFAGLDVHNPNEATVAAAGEYHAEHLVDAVERAEAKPQTRSVRKMNNHLPAGTCVVRGGGAAAYSLGVSGLLHSKATFEQVLPAIGTAKRLTDLNRKRRRQLASPKWRRQQKAFIELQKALRRA